MNNKYLEQFRNKNLINAGYSTMIPEELKVLNNSYYQRKAGFSILNRETLMEFLKEENSTVDDCVNYMNQEARSKNLVFDLNETLDVYYSYYSKNKPYVGNVTIENGIKNGLVNYISGVLVKKEDGWFNELGEKKLDLEVELKDFIKFINKKVNIVKEYSIDDLREIEKKGEYFIDNKLIAKLVNKGDSVVWLDLERNKEFDKDDLIRLLHHRDEVIILSNNNIQKKYYHANLSKSDLPQTEIKVRENSSKQGTAFYASSSLDEVVKTYGNPYSFELRGKLLSLKDNGEDIEGVNKAHLYEIKSKGNVFNANIYEMPSIYELPSLPLLLALGEEKINKEYIHSLWLRMKDSSSTYEVYQHLNEFNDHAYSSYGIRNLMIKALKSMNYDILEINFPEETISVYDKKIKEIKNSSENETVKDNIIKRLDLIIKELKDSIPAKAENSHLITFNKEDVIFKHIGLLKPAEEPKFDEKYNVVKKGLYWSDEKITNLDSILIKEKKKNSIKIK